MFDNPTFREPTPAEIAQVVRAVGEVPPVVVAFDFDGYAGGDGGVSCVIAAEAYDVRINGIP